ncbi:Recombination protein N [Rickettsiales bacterium Ac37b]|nr:Recombination protein N [Rickettsiales bacterium Ac37b]
MLISLYIKDFLLIEQAEIDFNSNLCVITGETGAGKSILLDALLFSLGYKASNKYIRTNKSQATVVSTFNVDFNKGVQAFLEEHNIESEGELVLRRTISLDGKSKIFVNDTLVKNTLVKQLAEMIVEIHGQNEQSNLLSPDSHLAILDAFGNLKGYVEAVKKVYQELHNKQTHLYHIKDLQRNHFQEKEYLCFSIEEIKKLAPKVGEESDLLERRSSLLNIEKTSETINKSLAELTLHCNVLKAINNTTKLLNRNTVLQTECFSIIASLEENYIELSEVIAQLEHKQSQMNSFENNLEDIEQRLFDLRAIARKYNCSSNNLPEYLEQLEQKFAGLNIKQDEIDQLEEELEQFKKMYIEAAGVLSKERAKAAEQLELSIMQELSSLYMEKAIFSVIITQKSETNWDITGIDNVYFSAATNPGLPTSPLNKIASGGELSRFMLAIKIALLKIHSSSIMIFDEIDTGVGGAVADAIGNKLLLLSHNTQVIVITHQPQIASKGKLHLHVIKEHTPISTVTNIKEISGSERTEEIARMLSGQHITKEAKAAADKLLDV